MSSPKKIVIDGATYVLKEELPEPKVSKVQEIAWVMCGRFGGKCPAGPGREYPDEECEYLPHAKAVLLHQLKGAQDRVEELWMVHKATVDKITRAAFDMPEDEYVELMGEVEE